MTNKYAVENTVRGTTRDIAIFAMRDAAGDITRCLISKATFGAVYAATFNATLDATKTATLSAVKGAIA